MSAQDKFVDPREQHHAELVAATTGLAHKMLKLHAPSNVGECTGCDCSNSDSNFAEWPCSTYQLLVEELEGAP
jgi:hypothetical protein